MAIYIHCMSICPFRSARIRGQLAIGQYVCDLSSTQKASVYCPLHCTPPWSIIWLSSALSSILSCVSISIAGGRVSSPAYYLSLNRSGLEVVANSRAGGSRTMCRHVHVRCWDSGLGRAAAIYLLTCAPFIISRHLTYKERNQQQHGRQMCCGHRYDKPTPRYFVDQSKRVSYCV